MIIFLNIRYYRPFLPSKFKSLCKFFRTFVMK